MRQVTSTTKQDAVRQVIKMLIRDKHLKKQPTTTKDGWWEGVSCEVIE